MNNLIKLDSTNPQYYHLLADMYMQSANSKFAVKTMDKLLTIHPERIQSLLKLSEIYFILKKHDESISTVNKILYLSPNNPEAYFMLGENFKENEEFYRAKNSFLTAVENDPEHVEAWIELGLLAEHQNDKKAEIYYKNAISIDTSYNALHYLAYYYQNEDRFKESIDVYKRMCALQPSNPTSFLNMGLIYFKLDSMERAYDNFNIFVNLDKGNPRAYYYRGLTLYAAGNDDEAKKDFKMALQLSPGYIEAEKMLKKLK